MCVVRAAEGVKRTAYMSQEEVDRGMGGADKSQQEPTEVNWGSNREDARVETK